MKASLPNKERGLTLLEIVAVVVVLGVLAVVIVPALLSARRFGRQIGCVNNLKNVGLCFRIFATDHAGKMPMDLLATNGGTREWTSDPSQLWRNFQFLSNELITPRLLWCPPDRQKEMAGTFAPNLTNPVAVVFSSNRQLSYFLGLNANDEQPNSILGGDRNLTTNGIPVTAGRLLVTADHALGFNKKIDP